MDNLIQVCGWIANFLFLMTSILMALKVFRKQFVKYETDVMYMWLIAEVLGLFYGIGIGEYPLIFNYGAAFLCLIYVWRNNGKRK